MGHFVGVMVMLVRTFSLISAFFRQTINRIWIFKKGSYYYKREKKFKVFFVEKHQMTTMTSQRMKTPPPQVATWNPNTFYSVAKQHGRELLILPQNYIWTVHIPWMQDTLNISHHGFE